MLEEAFAAWSSRYPLSVHGACSVTVWLSGTTAFLMKRELKTSPKFRSTTLLGIVSCRDPRLLLEGDD